MAKLSEFTTDPHNANKGTQRGLKALDTSVRKYGMGRSILADRKGRIIAGNKTAERAADIGIEDVIVVESDGTKLVVVKRTDLDLEDDGGKARALATYDNRSGQLDLDWDIDALSTVDADVLKDLWTVDELDELGIIEKPQGDAEPQIDRAAELQEKWQVKTGDLWRIGDHRLLCGDSTKREDVEKVMQGEKAELAPVDPPYNVGFDYDGKTVDDDKNNEKYEQFTQVWFELCGNVSDKQIVTPGCKNLPLWMKWFEAYHWTPWIKSNAMTNGKVSRFWCWEPMLFYGAEWKRKRTNDIFDFPIGEHGGVANHPCPKPLKMWNDLIENYSNNNAIVYDCFCGSGTTIVACQNLGRKCRAIEISPGYCAVTLERMAQAFPGIEIERQLTVEKQS